MIPKGFLPEVDASTLRAYTLAQQGISFQSMKAHQDALNKILLADPNPIGFFSSLQNGNSGFIFLHLKDPKEFRPKVPSPTMVSLEQKYGDVPVVGSLLRAAAPLFWHHPDITEVMQEMRMHLGTIPGISVFIQNPPPIQIGGQVTNSPYQVTLQSPDIQELYRVATDFEQKMEHLPGLIGRDDQSCRSVTLR